MAIRLADRWGGWRHLAQARLDPQRSFVRPRTLAAAKSRWLAGGIVRRRFLLAFDLIGIAVAADEGLAELAMAAQPDSDRDTMSSSKGMSGATAARTAALSVSRLFLIRAVPTARTAVPFPASVALTTSASPPVRTAMPSTRQSRTMR